jgi:hypothetical protein
MSFFLIRRRKADSQPFLQPVEYLPQFEPLSRKTNFSTFSFQIRSERALSDLYLGRGRGEESKKGRTKRRRTADFSQRENSSASACLLPFIIQLPNSPTPQTPHSMPYLDSDQIEFNLIETLSIRVLEQTRNLVPKGTRSLTIPQHAMKKDLTFPQHSN